MFLLRWPNRFISRAAGTRNAVEGDELLPGMSRCRGLPEVATRDSNRNALAKSVHFRLAWPVEDALPAAHLPAPASFAELTEAGRHPPGDLRAKVPKISPSSLTSASSHLLFEGQKVTC